MDGRENLRRPAQGASRQIPERRPLPTGRLIRHLEDGHISIDNNAAENMIHPPLRMDGRIGVSQGIPTAPMPLPLSTV
jgi:hypothetical protein